MEEHLFHVASVSKVALTHPSVSRTRPSGLSDSSDVAPFPVLELCCSSEQKEKRGFSKAITLWCAALVSLTMSYEHTTDVESMRIDVHV